MGVMKFKILLSPTKNTNSVPIRNRIVSIPMFIQEAEYIVKDLKKMNVDQLAKMMSISTKIAELNIDRFNNWRISCGVDEEFHAIQMYSGEAFKAFDFSSLKDHYHARTQETLFILSGLYGILKPFDLIYPYRLEMGLNYSPNSADRNLYKFWSEKLTQFLDVNLKKDDVIFNLASQEYSNVIDFKKLGRRVITPQFKEFKKNKYSNVSMFSKSARGKMARFIIENDIKQDKDLKSFNLDGYSFSEKLSADNEWVFVR